jgi:predicted PurR-regulated permease PerM
VTSPTGPSAERRSANGMIIGLLATIVVMLAMPLLHLGASLLIPVALAVLLYAMLSPVVAAGVRFGIPRGVTTAALLLLVVMLVVLTSFALADPAADWIDRAPRSFDEIKRKLASLTRSLKEIEDATQEVQNLGATGSEEAPALEVVVKETGLSTTVFIGTGQFLVGLLVTVVLSAFLLATGGRVGRDLAGLLPRFGDRRRLMRITLEIKREISHFLLTVTIINIGLGLAAAGVCWAVGLPNPLLWGVVCGVLNYLPFVGPTMSLAIVSLVGLLTFPHWTEALLAPALILGLNVIESQFVTPTLLALRLSLSPVIVFLAILLWGWLWGIAGVLLAVPLLTMAKITCDHVPALKALGRVLGQRRDRR